MKDNQAKYPQLRFKGFTNPWEKRKLGDTKTHFTDGNYGESYPSAKDMSNKENGVPFLRGSDFSNGYLDSSNANYIRPEKHAELTSGHIQQDDIILAVRGSLGTLGYATQENEGWNINSQLAILRTNKSEILGKFLIQYLLGSKGKKEILSRNTGTALKQLPIKQLKNIPVPVPILEEQQKIGSFFKQLDDIIALHQRKLAKLKELKQGYLQRLFPKNGSKFPQLRFTGFADAWEQRKLGELGNVTTGKAFSSNEFDQKGEYLVITNKDISDSSRSQNVLPDRINVSDEKLINKYNLSGNNILVTMDGVNLGKTAKFSNDKALLAQRVGRIQSNQLEFIYQVTASPEFLLTMRTLSVGNAIKHISLQQISNYTSFVPNSKAEQQKIGSFFKQLDSTIALHQRKLEKLQELKKGYLQKMFC